MIVFNTGFMDKYASLVDNTVPSDEFWNKQEKRPYFTLEAVEWIVSLNIAKCFIIDNVSFESADGMINYFPVTTKLMNIDESKKTFIPLVYHALITSEVSNMLCRNKLQLRIELGNVPEGLIPGFPVKIIVT